MNTIFVITKRELSAYFNTPIAYVILVIFLALSSSLTFYLGNFYERNQADLISFFNFHPWLYLFLAPAIAMRLWAEERKSGTIELLLTLPIRTTHAVLGKFLASWIFLGLALLLTCPIWITVNFLGEPDNGVILASYIGSWLMAGGFLAIGSCISACTKNQVIAFVVSMIVCFLCLLSGLPIVLDIFNAVGMPLLTDIVRQMSFLSNFRDISKGVIDFSAIFYFFALIGFWLYANTIVIEMKKSD